MNRQSQRDRCRATCHWLLACILGLGAVASKSYGQWMDSFEGGEPRWRLVESDCQAQITGQEISLIFPHGGQTSELLELSCGNGTLALLAYPIEPCTVIEEFQPVLWTRCASSQIRLGVRVLFPFALDPNTGRRLSAILWGSAYSDTGSWQRLELRDLPALLEREKVALRKRFGPDLQLEGNFIDCLVLNAYTAPGRTRLQIDDLDLRGLVSMAAIGNPPPADWRAQWRWQPPAVDPKRQYWEHPNQIPVWLQHRGESLPWVESLGFTGIVTDQVPSPDQLLQAKRSGLGVVSPPPDVALKFPEEAVDSIRGWLIGAALDSRQSEFARQQANLVASFPRELRKPLIAEALEGYFTYSRFADEVIVPMPTLTSAGTLQQKSHWLTQKLATTSQRGAGLVSVNLGVPPSLAGQLETAAGIVEPNSDNSEMSVNPAAFRHQVTAAVVSGARGILLRTFRPLDIRNSADSAQVAALRLAQNDLRLWGPWIAAGEFVQRPAVNDPNWSTAAWSIEGSQLVIAQCTDPQAQSFLPPTFQTPLEIGCATASPGQSVFRLTAGNLQRVDSEMTAAGLKWRVDEPAPVEHFVISQRPLVLGYLRQSLSRVEEQNAADLLEVTSYELAQAVRVMHSRTAVSADPAQQAALTRELRRETSARLNQAQQQIDRAAQALRSRQATASTSLLLSASNEIHAVLFDGYLAALNQLDHPQSSPLALIPAGLHMHWRISDACARSTWETRTLAGSSFTSLDSLVDAGWIQERRLEDLAALRVELVPASETHSAGLRMAAYARSRNQPLNGGFEGASLRVRSAGTEVSKGQFIRVTAEAFVRKTGDALGTGILVYDNQAGPSLGQLVSGTEGSIVPIELFRFAVDDGDFRLLAECRGECDIVIQNLEIRVVQPATNRRGYPTVPENMDIPLGYLPTTSVSKIAPKSSTAPVASGAEELPPPADAPSASPTLKTP